MILLDNKVPPPVVALVLAPIMWGLSHLLPRIDAPTPLRIALTAVIACTGLAFSGAGSPAFKRARTTVNPLRPERASALVITGVYRFTRNPMYVGMMLGLLSWAVYLASPLSLLGPVAFIAYITRFQIRPEERVLSAKFGPAYEQYMATVRRWI
jgi:protein-S-isoprenylcysteine O-methyltransferase Ste14